VTFGATMEKEYVIYNGRRMVKGWPERIIEAQKVSHYSIDGRLFERVRYGSERDDWGADQHPCHDCAVLKGQYHVPRCDGEQCPKCGEQVISCDCDYDAEKK
jgi:hypothetical protein